MSAFQTLRRSLQAGRWFPLMLLALLVWAPSARASSDEVPLEPEIPVTESKAEAVGDTAPELSTPDHGFWLDDAYRYGRAGLLERVARDLVAIPAGVARWDAQDWGIFLSLATIVGGMMIPFDDHPDYWFQTASKQLGPWRNQTWTPITDVTVWGGIFVAISSTFLYGYINERHDLLEATSLMSEAFILGQIAQFVFKFALGREGPEDGDGLGRILGPAEFFRLFPSGTPSGHAMTFFALMGALNTYVDSPTLTLAMVPVGLVFAFTLVISDYHYLSDVVWGATMGYAIGNWVVRHRRSKPGTAHDSPNWKDWLVTPWVNPRTGASGAALTVVF
ncbi:MAG TPA: phosphatase PAP2 family protein [Myxococcaceae bacterium]|nr:phosphatase PAP2 family protein [Myxococcaceae bacterium]